MSYVWDNACPWAFRVGISFESLAGGLGPDRPSVDFRDPAPGPYDAQEAAEVHAAVGAFIASLRARDREIVRSIFWNGETQAQVARRLGVSKMAISKAMSKIAVQGRRRLAAYSACSLLN